MGARATGIPLEATTIAIIPEKNIINNRNINNNSEIIKTI
jgi:hypothetical protein